MPKEMLRLYAHTDPLFSSLTILPFPGLIEREKTIFMHSIEFTYITVSFINEFIKN